MIVPFDTKAKEIKWYEAIPMIASGFFSLLFGASTALDLYGRTTIPYLPLHISSFQSLTMFLTFFLFLVLYWELLDFKIPFINRILISTIVVVLATHYYEVTHALGQLYATGTTGNTLWILNIPVVIGTILLLFFFDNKYNFLNIWEHKFLVSFTPFLFGISFYFLAKSGFYQDITNKGILW